MANKTKKYNSFREWLIWCTKGSPNSAKTVVSYLRRIEEEFLEYHLGTPDVFSQVHQILNDIDAGKKPHNEIDGAKEILKCVQGLLHDAKDGARNIKPRCDCKSLKKDSISSEEIRESPDIEYELLRGAIRAFNGYLKFLTDVTDCFGIEDALEINPRIRDDFRDADDPNYEKRLLIFRHGLASRFIKFFNVNDYVEAVLDSFSEIVERYSLPNNPAVATQFSLNEVASPSRCSWRSEVLNHINYSIAKNYSITTHRRCKRGFNVIREQPVHQTTDLLINLIANTYHSIDFLYSQLDPEERIVQSPESRLSLIVISALNNDIVMPGFDKIEKIYYQCIEDLKAYILAFKIELY